MQVEFNDEFFRRVGHSDEMARAVMVIAEAAAGIARATAPVDTGAYRDSIRAELYRGRTRVVGRVNLTDPKSLLIESRTGNAIRALRSAGRGG